MKKTDTQTEANNKQLQQETNKQPLGYGDKKLEGPNRPAD